MIGTGTLLGNHAGRTGLELTIFQNRKIHVPPVQIGEPDPDSLANRVRICWIGEMTGLRPLNLLDVNPRPGVSAIRGSAQG